MRWRIVAGIAGLTAALAPAGGLAAGRSHLAPPNPGHSYTCFVGADACRLEAPRCLVAVAACSRGATVIPQPPSIRVGPAAGEGGGVERLTEALLAAEAGREWSLPPRVHLPAVAGRVP